MVVARRVLIMALALSAVLTAAPRPARVVSLIPAVTEMLFAMGAESDVIGVSSFDRFPAEVSSRPKVGGLLDPDTERIITLRPTLVVIYETQVELRDRLASVGIPTWLYRHGSVASIYDTIRGLGHALGRTADAEALTHRMQQQIADIKAALRGQPAVPTLFVIGRDVGALQHLNVAGGDGFLNEIVELAGGINVFRDVVRPAIDASTEQVLARRPEAILELWVNRRLDPATRQREAAVWNSLTALPAVRSRRIFEINDERLAVPGPRLPDGVRLFASLLHPDAVHQAASNPQAPQTPQ
jgi:iron complex transport system substrate-binding protein